MIVVGQPVTWLHVPSGGYGYPWPVPAFVVKVTEKRHRDRGRDAKRRVETAVGLPVLAPGEKRVSAEHTRELLDVLQAEISKRGRGKRTEPLVRMLGELSDTDDEALLERLAGAICPTSGLPPLELAKHLLNVAADVKNAKAHPRGAYRKPKAAA